MLNYEIHITVESGDITQFKADCEDLGIKPILIETENKESIGKQLMTSSKHTCEDDSVEYLFKLKELKEDLILLGGYNVIREKIEIYPQEEKHPNFIYYENHFKIKMFRHDYDRMMLEGVCRRRNFHLSKNIFKKNEDNTYYQMITFRNKDLTFKEFKEYIDETYKELTFNIGFNVDKIEIEECIFDSNISVDKSWLQVK